MQFAIIALLTAIASTASAGLCSSTFQANCMDGSTQTPIEADSGICVPHICANNGGARSIYGNTQVGEDCTKLKAFHSMDCSGASNAITTACNRGEGISPGTVGLYSFVAERS